MFHFYYIIKENIKEHLARLARRFWPSIQNINLWKFQKWNKNALLNQINHGPDIDKEFLYAKDPIKAKHQLLINKRETTCLKNLNDSKA